MDSPGFINYGPYFPLRRGKFIVVYSYRSAATNADRIGTIDVYNATKGKEVILAPIYGTNNSIRELEMKFDVTGWRSGLFEFRTHWNGLSNIEIKSITLNQALN